MQREEISPVYSNLIWGLADWYTKDTCILPTWFFSSGSEVHKQGLRELDPLRIAAKGIWTNSLTAFFNRLITYCTAPDTLQPGLVPESATLQQGSRSAGQKDLYRKYESQWQQLLKLKNLTHVIARKTLHNQ